MIPPSGLLSQPVAVLSGRQLFTTPPHQANSIHLKAAADPARQRPHGSLALLLSPP